MSYPLALPTWGEEELTAAKEVLDSGFYTMGKKVEAFEKETADFFGSKYSVMVNSGSSANLLAVSSLFYRKSEFLKKGDEVIVPAVSWSTSYTPLQQYGLKLKFVDIDLGTLNYDLEKLESAVTDKTKMILVVNLLGNPNDFKFINKLALDNNIIVVEDNCESMGAKFDSKYCGTHSLLGTFSTFFSHHMCTMEGGFVLTDDEELYHIMLSMRAHGWTRNLPIKNHVTGEKSQNDFEESFNFVLPGYNIRPMEISGAIGLEQLKKLPNFIQERRNNAEVFCSLFENQEGITIQKEIGESSWFGFSIVLKDHLKGKRTELIADLSKFGVECRPIVAGNFVKNPVMKYFDYEVHSNLVNADYIDENGFFIGNHHLGAKDALSKISKVVQRFS